MFNLLVYVDYKSLPPGIIRTLLSLWELIRDSFVSMLDFFVSNVVDVPVLGGGGLSFLSLVMGVGVQAVLLYWIVKWLIP